VVEELSPLAEWEIIAFSFTKVAPRKQARPDLLQLGSYAAGKVVGAAADMKND